MLIKIIARAKELIRYGIQLHAASATLDFFLKQQSQNDFINHLEKFCELDDTDVMCTIKNWCEHPDKILSRLCKGLVDRKLLKVKFQAGPFEQSMVMNLKSEVANQLKISEEEADYFVFTGEAQNTTYDPYDEHINVLFKDGTIRDISQVDNALIHQQLSAPVKKYYLCYLR